MKLKKVMVLSLSAMVAVAIAVDYRNAQRSDIQSLVKEINYLIETTKQMKSNYASDNSKIRFNYDALIKQLEVAKNGTNQYLKLDFRELHTQPPKPVKTEITIVD